MEEKEVLENHNLRERELEGIRQKVENITDGLGYPIEAGIKETIVILNAFGLKTTASCEGHTEIDLENNHELNSPWVEIYPQEPEEENWMVKDKLRKVVEKENFENKIKIINLLDEFYRYRQNNDRTYDLNLITQQMGYGFKLQSLGSDVLEILPENEKLEKIDLYRKEMQSFTEFLKNKFLNK